MFGGFGTKFSLIARKIVAQASEIATAWPSRFLGLQWTGNYSFSGDPIINQTESAANVLGSSVRWKYISVGNRSSMGIKENGTLWGWGGNFFRTLGTNDSSNRISPVQIGALTDWAEVKVGSFSTMGRRTDNTLWRWGVNYAIGGSSPVQVNSDADWASFSTLGWGGFAIKSNGTLWAMGYNHTNTEASRLLPHRFSEFPVRVGVDTNWQGGLSKLGGTRHNTIAIKSNGTLWTWGTGSTYPVATIALSSTPTQIGSTNTWSDIFCGNLHALALRSDGTLWSWGTGYYGSLGLGNQTDRNSPVQIGTNTDWVNLSIMPSRNTNFGFNNPRSSFAIRAASTGATSGGLWAWGNNYNGQLGLGNAGANTNRSSPVQVGTDTDWAWVSGGNNHTAAIKTNGTLWAWGQNNIGQLGLGNTTNLSSPVQVGSGATGDWAKVFVTIANNTFAIKTNGTLWAWGLNTSGMFGRGDTTNRSSPVQVGTATDWDMVSAHSSLTIGKKTNGTLWFAGTNAAASGYLQTGSQIPGNTTTFTQLNSSFNAGGTAAWTTGVINGGSVHAVKDDGSLWTWGYRQATSGLLVTLAGITGWYGSAAGSALPSRPIQVGSGTTGPWAKVSSGSYSIGNVLLLKTDGTLWAGGFNLYGALGINSSNAGPRSSPVQIGSNTWIDIAANNRVGAAIRSNGTLWTWGRNNGGQLGLRDTTNRSSPTQVGSNTDWLKLIKWGSTNYALMAAIKTDGTLWGWGLNNSGVLGLPAYSNASPRQIGSSTNWSFAQSGTNFGIAKRSDGTLWSWGRNFEGNLGLGDTVNRSSPVQIGTDDTWNKFNLTNDTYSVLATKTNNTLWAWGSNTTVGLLGLGDTNNRSSPTQVGALSDWSYVCISRVFACAVKTDGTLWSWGQNNYGQLGSGTTVSRSSPVQVGTDVDWKYVRTSGYGSATSFAIKTNGTLWAWGRNNYGQLGQGNTTNRSSPVQIGSGTTGPWTKVVSSSGACAALRTNGSLWVWGINNFGQLGLGDTTNRSSPVQLGSATDWENIWPGLQVTFAKKTNGTLWVWGRSLRGVSGARTESNLSSPIQVGTDNDWAMVGSGRMTLLIKNNGTMWHCGRRDTGGHGGSVSSGPFASISSPVQIGSDTDWKTASIGGNSSYPTIVGLKDT